MFNNIIGIIGQPVSHSLSPLIHNSAFKHLGLEAWIYVPMPVAKYPYIRIKEAVLGLKALGFKGANVTVPYKESVLPYMDDLDEKARSIGAVNTISIDAEEKLIGYNTDAWGFINDLKERQIDTSLMDVLLLGAGGSARAVAYGLLDYGCKSLTILNRTESKASEIALHMQSLFRGKAIKSDVLSAEKIKKYQAFQLIINCTSLGLADQKEQMAWDKSVAFSKDQIIYDLIYKPKKTVLLKKAEADGARAINGLGMLVHQAALAFTIWTGQQAPIEVMKRSVLP